MPFDLFLKTWFLLGTMSVSLVWNGWKTNACDVGWVLRCYVHRCRSLILFLTNKLSAKKWQTPLDLLMHFCRNCIFIISMTFSKTEVPKLFTYPTWTLQIRQTSWIFIFWRNCPPTGLESQIKQCSRIFLVKDVLQKTRMKRRRNVKCDLFP